MELISLSYSPWSVRAKWALDHHALDFERTEYLPMLGTPWLRKKTGRWFGKITVPLLIEDDRTHFDSFDIALRADELGRGSKLLSPDLVPAIRAWNSRAETLMQAGRARTTTRIFRDPRALRENLPKWLPGPLRTASIPVAHLGSLYLARKYDFSLRDASELADEMRGVLQLAQKALEDREFLLDKFTYADVIVACALQFVSPVEGWIPLGQRSRALWRDDEVATDFADLLQWRDKLFADRAPWKRR